MVDWYYKVSISFLDNREDHYEEFLVKMTHSEADLMIAQLSAASKKEMIRDGQVEAITAQVMGAGLFQELLEKEYDLDLSEAFMGPKDWRPGKGKKRE
jgi:hypothetical protein